MTNNEILLLSLKFLGIPTTVVCQESPKFFHNFKVRKAAHLENCSITKYSGTLVGSVATFRYSYNIADNKVLYNIVLATPEPAKIRKPRKLKVKK